MASNFFIDKKLQKTIDKDIKKRNAIEEKIKELQNELDKVNIKIDKDLENFYIQVDKDTVLSTLKYHEEHSSEKKAISVSELRNRFQSSNLIIEDTQTLIDWYEQMRKYYNDKI